MVRVQHQSMESLPVSVQVLFEVFDFLSGSCSVDVGECPILRRMIGGEVGPGVCQRLEERSMCRDYSGIELRGRWISQLIDPRLNPSQLALSALDVPL